MDAAKPSSIVEHFSILRDPRIDRTKRHKLLDIVAIAICAVVCGADSWVDVELFGKSKKDWLSKFLELPGGIPSHDTFSDLFNRLDAEQFQECFISWVQAVQEVTKGRVLAIDGKTLRRSHDKAQGKGPIHMVSAWSAANRLVLGQVKVDDKSNEITAIPELLRILDITGCIVTIDAMGCQREIARTIVQQGGDYILAVKDNQKTLHDDIRDLFDTPDSNSLAQGRHDYAETVHKGHGRIETRQCWTISDPDSVEYLQSHASWDGLQSVAKVTAHRQIGAETSKETRYFITSLPGDAARLLQSIREHWGIENSVHWVLDIAFREDESRVRKGNGPQNFAVLRHIALNLLKQERTSKGGVKARRLRAGWDEHYLIKVLTG